MNQRAGFCCFTFLFLLILSCKSDDGSIRYSRNSIKKRITGEWLLTKVAVNDSLEVGRDQNEFLTLKEDGTGTFKIIRFGSLFYLKSVNWNLVNKSSSYKSNERIFIYQDEGTLKIGTLYKIRKLTDIFMELESRTDSLPGQPGCLEVRTYCKWKE